MCSQITVSYGQRQKRKHILSHDEDGGADDDDTVLYFKASVTFIGIKNDNPKQLFLICLSC
jgi:hypothetical protein